MSVMEEVQKNPLRRFRPAPSIITNFDISFEDKTVSKRFHAKISSQIEEWKM